MSANSIKSDATLTFSVRPVDETKKNETAEKVDKKAQEIFSHVSRISFLGNRYKFTLNLPKGAKDKDKLIKQYKKEFIDNLKAKLGINGEHSEKKGTFEIAKTISITFNQDGYKAIADVSQSGLSQQELEAYAENDLTVEAKESAAKTLSENIRSLHVNTPKPKTAVATPPKSTAPGKDAVLTAKAFNAEELLQTPIIHPIVPLIDGKDDGTDALKSAVHLWANTPLIVGELLHHPWLLKSGEDSPLYKTLVQYREQQSNSNSNGPDPIDLSNLRSSLKCTPSEKEDPLHTMLRLFEEQFLSLKELENKFSSHTTEYVRSPFYQRMQKEAFREDDPKAVTPKAMLTSPYWQPEGSVEAKMMIPQGYCFDFGLSKKFEEAYEWCQITRHEPPNTTDAQILKRDSYRNKEEDIPIFMVKVPQNPNTENDLPEIPLKFKGNILTGLSVYNEETKRYQTWVREKEDEKFISERQELEKKHLHLPEFIKKSSVLALMYSQPVSDLSGFLAVQTDS